MAAAEADRKKTIGGGIIFFLPSVTTSADGEEVKHALCLTSIVNVLFSMDHIIFVHKKLQREKTCVNFCHSSLLEKTHFPIKINLEKFLKVLIYKISPYSRTTVIRILRTVSFFTTKKYQSPIAANILP